ncbi:MAG: DUF2922 domain-containing protein [Bacillales bacterium]|nr:DUF2922 domain-containing protein [Bacillales bacterium]
MAKTLELQFKTELGKTAAISVDSPKETLSPAEMKVAMASIIAANVFQTPNGSFVGIQGARLVERNSTDYHLE